MSPGFVITSPPIDPQDTQGLIAWWRSLWFDAHNDVQPLRDAAAACRAYAAKIEPVAADATAILTTGLTSWDSQAKASYLEDWKLNYGGIQGSYDGIHGSPVQPLLPSLHDQMLSTADALDDLAGMLENYLTGLRAQKWQEVVTALVIAGALATIELGGEGGLLLGICAQMGVDLAGALAILGAQLASWGLGTVVDLVAPLIPAIVMPTLDAATAMFLSDVGTQLAVNAVAGEHISMITGKPESGVDWGEAGLSALSGAVMGAAGGATAAGLEPAMSSANPLVRQVITRGLGVALGALGDVPFQIATVASDGWNWHGWNWQDLAVSGAFGGLMGGRIRDLAAQRPDIIVETADDRVFHLTAPDNGGSGPGRAIITDPLTDDRLGSSRVPVDILNPRTGDVISHGSVGPAMIDRMPVATLEFGQPGVEPAVLDGATLHTFSADAGLNRYVAYQVSGDKPQPVFQTETTRDEWTRISTFDAQGNPQVVEVQGKLPADAYVNLPTREALGDLPAGATVNPDGTAVLPDGTGLTRFAKGSWLALRPVETGAERVFPHLALADGPDLRVTAATRPMADVATDELSWAEAHTTELYIQGPDDQLHRLGFVRGGSPTGTRGYEFYASVEGMPIEIRHDGRGRVVVLDGIQRFSYGPSGRVELTVPARVETDPATATSTEAATATGAADTSAEQVQHLGAPQPEAAGAAEATPALGASRPSAEPSISLATHEPYPLPVAERPLGGQPGEKAGFEPASDSQAQTAEGAVRLRPAEALDSGAVTTGPGAGTQPMKTWSPRAVTDGPPNSSPAITRDAALGLVKAGPVLKQADKHVAVAPKPVAQEQRQLLAGTPELDVDAAAVTGDVHLAGDPRQMVAGMTELVPDKAPADSERYRGMAELVPRAGEAQDARRYPADDPKQAARAPSPLAGAGRLATNPARLPAPTGAADAPKPLEVPAPAEVPPPVTTVTRPVITLTTAVTEMTRPVTEMTKPVTAIPEPVAELPPAVTVVPKHGTGTPGRGADIPGKPGTGNSEPGTRPPEPGEAPVREVPTPVTRVTIPVTKMTAPVTEMTKPVADVPPPVAEVTLPVTQPPRPPVIGAPQPVAEAHRPQSPRGAPGPPNQWLLGEIRRNIGQVFQRRPGDHMTGGTALQANGTVSDLADVRWPEEFEPGDNPYLKLSDTQLLARVFSLGKDGSPPITVGRIKLVWITGLHQTLLGDYRLADELRRRADDPGSSITSGTPIPIRYTGYNPSAVWQQEWAMFDPRQVPGAVREEPGKHTMPGLELSVPAWGRGQKGLIPRSLLLPGRWGRMLGTGAQVAYQAIYRALGNDFHMWYRTVSEEQVRLPDGALFKVVTIGHHHELDKWLYVASDLSEPFPGKSPRPLWPGSPVGFEHDYFEILGTSDSSGRATTVTTVTLLHPNVSGDYSYDGQWLLPVTTRVKDGPDLSPARDADSATQTLQYIEKFATNRWALSYSVPPLVGNGLGALTMLWNHSHPHQPVPFVHEVFPHGLPDMLPLKLSVVVAEARFTTTHLRDERDLLAALDRFGSGDYGWAFRLEFRLRLSIDPQNIPWITEDPAHPANPIIGDEAIIGTSTIQTVYLETDFEIWNPWQARQIADFLKILKAGSAAERNQRIRELADYLLHPGLKAISQADAAARSALSSSAAAADAVGDASAPLARATTALQQASVRVAQVAALTGHGSADTRLIAAARQFIGRASGDLSHARGLLRDAGISAQQADESAATAAYWANYTAAAVDPKGRHAGAHSQDVAARPEGPRGGQSGQHGLPAGRRSAVRADEAAQTSAQRQLTAIQLTAQVTNDAAHVVALVTAAEALTRASSTWQQAQTEWAASSAVASAAAELGRIARQARAAAREAAAAVTSQPARDLATTGDRMAANAITRAQSAGRGARSYSSETAQAQSMANATLTAAGLLSARAEGGITGLSAAADSVTRQARQAESRLTVARTRGTRPASLTDRGRSDAACSYAATAAAYEQDASTRAAALTGQAQSTHADATAAYRVAIRLAEEASDAAVLAAHPLGWAAAMIAQHLAAEAVADAGTAVSSAAAGGSSAALASQHASTISGHAEAARAEASRNNPATAGQAAAAARQSYTEFTSGADAAARQLSQSAAITGSAARFTEHAADLIARSYSLDEAVRLASEAASRPDPPPGSGLGPEPTPHPFQPQAPAVPAQQAADGVTPAPGSGDARAAIASLRDAAGKIASELGLGGEADAVRVADVADEIWALADDLEDRLEASPGDNVLDLARDLVYELRSIVILAETWHRDNELRTLLRRALIRFSRDGLPLPPAKPQEPLFQQQMPSPQQAGQRGPAEQSPGTGRAQGSGGVSAAAQQLATALADASISTEQAQPLGAPQPESSQAASDLTSIGPLPERPAEPQSAMPVTKTSGTPAAPGGPATAPAADLAADPVKTTLAPVQPASAEQGTTETVTSQPVTPAKPGANQLGTADEPVKLAPVTTVSQPAGPAGTPVAKLVTESPGNVPDYPGADRWSAGNRLKPRSPRVTGPLDPLRTHDEPVPPGDYGPNNPLPGDHYPELPWSAPGTIVKVDGIDPAAVLLPDSSQFEALWKALWHLNLTTHLEHNVVELQDGTFEIVQAGKYALVDDGSLPINRVWMHVHPHWLPAEGPSVDDIRFLGMSPGQRTAVLIESGVLPYEYSVPDSVRAALGLPLLGSPGIPPYLQAIRDLMTRPAEEISGRLGGLIEALRQQHAALPPDEMRASLIGDLEDIRDEAGQLPLADLQAQTLDRLDALQRHLQGDIASPADDSGPVEAPPQANPHQPPDLSSYPGLTAGSPLKPIDGVGNPIPHVGQHLAELARYLRYAYDNQLPLVDGAGRFEPEILIANVPYHGPNGTEMVVQRITWMYSRPADSTTITMAFFTEWPARWGPPAADGRVAFTSIGRQEIQQAQAVREGPVIEPVPLQQVIRPLLRALADNGFETLVLQGDRQSGMRFGGKLANKSVPVLRTIDLTRYRGTPPASAPSALGPGKQPPGPPEIIGRAGGARAGVVPPEVIARARQLLADAAAGRAGAVGLTAFAGELDALTRGTDPANIASPHIMWIRDLAADFEFLAAPGQANPADITAIISAKLDMAADAAPAPAASPRGEQAGHAGEQLPDPRNQWFMQKFRQAAQRLQGDHPSGKPTLPAANSVVSALADAYRPDFQPDNPYSVEKGQKIGRLSDSQLLDAVFRPRDGSFIAVERRMTPWGWREAVVEGNHRVDELLSRAGRPDSSITPDTPIYVRYLGDSPPAAQPGGPPDVYAQAGPPPGGVPAAALQLATALSAAKQAARALVPGVTPLPTGLFGSVIDPQTARVMGAAVQLMTEARDQLANLNRIIQTITPDAWLQRSIHGHPALRNPFLSAGEMSELNADLWRAARLVTKLRQSYAGLREAYERSVAAAQREAAGQLQDPQAHALADALVGQIAALRPQIMFELKTATRDGALTRSHARLRVFAAELDPARVAAQHGLSVPVGTAPVPQRLSALLTSLDQASSAFLTLADPAQAGALPDPVATARQASDELWLAQKIAKDKALAADFTATLERQLKGLASVTRRLVDAGWSLRMPADVAQMAELNLEIGQATEALQKLRGQHPGLSLAHDVALARRRSLEEAAKASTALAKLADAISSGESLPPLATLRNAVRTQLQTLDNLQQAASSAETWWRGLTVAEQAAITDPARDAMAAAGISQHLTDTVAEAAKYHAYAQANPHLRADIYHQYNTRLRAIRAALRAADPDAVVQRQRLQAEQREISGRKQALENEALITARHLHREAVQTRAASMLAHLRTGIAAHGQAIADRESRLSGARSQAGIGTTGEEARLARVAADRLTTALGVIQGLSDLASLAASPAGDGQVIDAALRSIESAGQTLGKEATRLADIVQEWQQARILGLVGDVASSQRRLSRAVDDVASRQKKIASLLTRLRTRLMSAPERKAAETARAIGHIAADTRAWDLTAPKTIGLGLPPAQQSLWQRLLSAVEEAQREITQLHQVAGDLAASAAQGDRLTALQRLTTAALAAGQVRDEVARVPGLVGELALSAGPRHAAATRRSSRHIRAFTGQLTRRTGKVQGLRIELESHLQTTGLPARIQALQAAVAGRRAAAEAAAAQLSRLRGELTVLRAATPQLEPFLPTGRGLASASDVADHVAWLARELDRVAGHFAIGGARRRQGRFGTDLAGIPPGTANAAASVRRAADLIGQYTHALEQIRASAQSAFDHASAGRLDAARTAAQAAYRRVTGLQSPVSEPAQFRAFVQAMTLSDRLMLPGPRSLADLTAEAGRGSTAAPQAAPLMQDALDEVRATPFWSEANRLEHTIRDAEQARNEVLHLDPATPFFDPLTLAANGEAAIVQMRYRPIWGWKFERPAFTPREGEFGQPLLTRLLRHPDDLLRTLLSLNRIGVQKFGDVDYVIRDAQGFRYWTHVVDHQHEMDRGPWGRDLNEQQFLHARSASWLIGPLEFAFTLLEQRAAYLVPVPPERYQWTRQQRTAAIDGIAAARWQFHVADPPRYVHPEPSVESRHMVRSKFEMHLRYLLPLPFLPEAFQPELYSNARVAVNKTLGSQHETALFRQLTGLSRLRNVSLSDLLGFLASGSAEKDSLQIEVSATALRVHVLPPTILQRLPLAGSWLNDKTYLRIGEFKFTYTGATAQDALIWLLERVHGGVLLGPEPLARNRLTPPPWAADIQRGLINPWQAGAEFSARPGSQAQLTVPERHLQHLRGNVSAALSILSRNATFPKGTGRVAADMHRYTASILRAARQLSSTAASGKTGFDPPRAQRITGLAGQADRIARELTGWVGAGPAGDAPAEFEARTAALRMLLEQIDGLLRDADQDPPAAPPASGETPSAPAAPSGAPAQEGGSPPAAPGATNAPGVIGWRRDFRDGPHVFHGLGAGPPAWLRWLRSHRSGRPGSASYSPGNGSW